MNKFLKNQKGISLITLILIIIIIVVAIILFFATKNDSRDNMLGTTTSSISYPTETLRRKRRT